MLVNIGSNSVSAVRRSPSQEVPVKALMKCESGPGHVELVERPAPSPGPHHALIEVHGCGVCGTDLHIEAGEYAIDPPVIMGHEVSGVVTAVGDDVPPSWIGERVVCETYFSTCQACELCQDGRRNLCPRRRSIGTHVDGGFAAHVVVPATNLHSVPQHVDALAATLAEPLACVCNCLLDPPAVQPGDRVVVVGPGPVGLLAAQVARAAGGIVTVCGLPRDASRLAVASSMGFDVSDERPPADWAQVVIECSGTSTGAAVCLESARRGGRYVQVGVFGGDVRVPLDRVFYAELTITSGFASTARSWRHAIDLLSHRAVDLAPLVTRAAPLVAWPDVFADLRDARGLKLVLDPRL